MVAFVRPGVEWQVGCADPRVAGRRLPVVPRLRTVTHRDVEAVEAALLHRSIVDVTSRCSPPTECWPAAELHEVCRRHGALLVHELHGLGVRQRCRPPRSLAGAARCRDDHDPVEGPAARVAWCSDRVVRAHLIDAARPFISTPGSPQRRSAPPAALRVLMVEPQRTSRADSMPLTWPRCAAATNQILVVVSVILGEPEVAVAAAAPASTRRTGGVLPAADGSRNVALRLIYRAVAVRRHRDGAGAPRADRGARAAARA